MDYIISQAEISRRKKAYTTLSISILLGLLLTSILFSIPIAIGVYLLVVGILMSLGLFSFVFFHKLSKTTIKLSSQALKRISNGTVEEYPLARIKRIRIKRTTSNNIREVAIWLDGRESIFISALDAF